MTELDKLGRKNSGGSRTMGRPRKLNTEDMIELFTLAALNNGHMSKGLAIFNEQRKEDGKEEIKLDTANATRRNEIETYNKIRSEVVETVRLSAAEKHMEAADTAMEVESELTTRLRKHIEDIDPRDLPGAIRNAATSAGIHRDKALALAGDSPGGITVNLNIGEQIRSAAAHGGRFYDDDGNLLTADEAIKRAQPAIESTAEELTTKEN